MKLARTYLVTINQEQYEDSDELAIMMMDDLSDSFEIISVKPWSEHNPSPLINVPNTSATPLGGNLIEGENSSFNF